jgi:CheY-like chemotaxis protein
VGLRNFGGAIEEGDLPAAVEVELSKLDNKKAMFLAARGSDPRRSDPGWRRDVTREINRLRKCMGDLPHPPKIVYVDDEMDKGWDEAIYFAITDERLPKEGVPWFHTSVGQLAHPKNSKEDWQEIAEMVLDQAPDLILTDLRLLGNSEARTAVKETSGAGLVAILRKRAPGVPILLLTASNKAWTMQEAFRLGVDAYWMKEGIGDHASPNRSIENTAELKGLLSHLLGSDYQLLRKIQMQTDAFKSAWTENEPPWWKEMQWEEPSPAFDPPALVPPFVTKPDFKAFFSLLESLARSYREYLRLVILRYGSQDLRGSRFEETTNFWLQSLVVHVGRIIEAIHGFDDIRSNVDQPGQRSLATGGTIGGYFDKKIGCARKMRRDWFGQSLYECRNIAAHYDPAAPVIMGENIRSLLAALFAWLSTKPACIESPHSLRVARDRTHLIWPKADDLFRGPDRDVELVSEYVKLTGSPRLDLPKRRP